MTHAYSDIYLSNAKHQLSQFFDYLINDCQMAPEWVTKLFIMSGYAERFEAGDPRIIAGMSGIELARAMIEKTYQKRKLPAPTLKAGASPEYWAGWALAEYQWFSGKRFGDIFECIPLTEIIQLYPIYHEMDITQFIRTMQDRCSQMNTISKLKRLREKRGLSQSDLAKRAGVNIRSIQMYEQKNNDIDKAQANTLYRIARIIGCKMEDLLESPMAN